MAIDEKKLIDADELIGRLEEYIEYNNAYIRRFSGKSPYQKNLYIESGIYKEIINLVNNMPKLSLETKTSDKWIPCSERLPEENGSYIVTSLDYVDTFEAVFDQGEWFSIDYCDDIKNVIAWMPLPEPYKGENDEN